MPKAEKEWLSVQKDEKVYESVPPKSWESVPNTEKVWESVPKVEKVCQILRKYNKVCQKLRNLKKVHVSVPVLFKQNST